MKIVGILSIGLLGAIAAAVQQLSSGAGLWAALASYLVVGFSLTVLSVAVLFIRSLDSGRPLTKAALRPAVNGAGE